VLDFAGKRCQGKTLADYEELQIMAVKSFALSPRVDVIKFYYFGTPSN